MPGWAATSAALQTDLAPTLSPYPLYVGDRYFHDQNHFQALFNAGHVPLSDKALIGGGRLVRESISERWFTQFRTESTETYRLRLATAVKTDTGSETEFQDLVDTVWARIRRLHTIGDALVISAAETPSVEYLEVGSILCHYAEIAIDVTERYLIGAVDQPAHTSSAATTRESYGDAAEEIGAYLEGVSGAGTVHRERPVGHNETDRNDLFMVDTATPGKRTVQAWEVYRARDVESRGIGNRVEGMSTYRLLNFRAWFDAGDSYDAFQRHIDDARAVVRGVGCLGNAANTTQTLSSPLQVRELGARMLMGILVHHADCEIKSGEVVHA